ncbi:MAG: hypothetical protein OXB95_08105 [Rhodobacteraceae bacterium]|nr:hypothetical protein [Paracoccaceae bacterium]
MIKLTRKLSASHRLMVALYHGQHWLVDQLLQAEPDLAKDNLAIQLAMYDRSAVLKKLSSTPGLATRKIGARTPILHMAFSRHIHSASVRTSDMLELANALMDLGADPNDSYNPYPEENCQLSALYGAMCHADNAALGELLLERGANPNDNESLYHATELAHTDGLKLLLQADAEPKGTNAILRALDFNCHEAVALLLAHGAIPNADMVEHPSGQPSLMVPALHHAARRMCDSRMLELLLEAGADPQMRHHGHGVYAYACMYGNFDAVDFLQTRGLATKLSELEQALYDAARSGDCNGFAVSEAMHTEETRSLLFNILHMEGRLAHCKRLAKLGYSLGQSDEMGLTPLHIAGWQGFPETEQWLLGQSPDLNHVNGYGGDIAATIVHGSENCPERKRRDHITCIRLAFEAGAKISDREIEYAGSEPMVEFLIDWVSSHPESLICELSPESG